MKKFDYASELNKVVKTEIKPTKIITDFNNLDNNIVVICEKLRNDGFLKEAIDLQQTYVQYKRAERELDGDKLLDLAHPKPTKIKDLNVEVKPIQDLKKDIMKLVGIKTAGADKTPKILNDAHPKPTKVLDTEVLSVQDCKEKIMKLVGIKNAGIKDLVRIIKKADDGIPDGYIKLSPARVYGGIHFNPTVLRCFKGDVIKMLGSVKNFSEEYKATMKELINSYMVDNELSYIYTPYSYFNTLDTLTNKSDEDNEKTNTAMINMLRGIFDIAKETSRMCESINGLSYFYYNQSKQLSGGALIGKDKAGKLYYVNYDGSKGNEVNKDSKATPSESPVQQTPNTPSAPGKPLSAESMRHVWSSVGKYDLGNMPDNVKNSIKSSTDADNIRYIYYRKPESSTGYMVWYENGIYYGWMNNGERPSINKDKAKTNTVSDMLDGIDKVTNEHYVYRPSKTGGGDHYDAYFNGEFIGTFQNTTLSPVAYWKSHTLIARNRGYTLARSGKYWWKKNQEGKTYTAYRLDDPNTVLQENVSMSAEPTNV